ncbi:MAG: MFS transporter [Proteobacteria bacterium]|nr:MFS transporter [Pseudomonadota bacterium]
MTIQTFLIWITATFFYAYQYLLRVIPNVLKTDISETFQFDSFLFGQFAGVWYIGYTLAHIPVGIALDRYGPRKVLPICALICALGLSPLILAENGIYPIMGRFIWGIGSTGATLGMFKIVEMYFSKDQFAKVISLSCIIGVLGAMLGAGPFMLSLVKLYTWKNILYTFILIGLMLSVIMLFILPKSPSIKSQNILSTLKTLLSNKLLWIISLGSGFLAGPLEGYADAWAMNSLMVIYNFLESTASQASFVIFLGFIFGLLSVSYLIKFLGHHSSLVIQGLILFFAFCLILSGQIPFPIIFGCLFMLGFCSSYQVITVELTIRLFPANMTGLTTAVFNMIMMAFGSFFHTIIGIGMNMFTTYDSNGKPLCDALSFQYGLSIIPIMTLIGTLCFIYLRKYRPLQK